MKACWTHTDASSTCNLLAAKNGKARPVMGAGFFVVNVRLTFSFCYGNWHCSGYVSLDHLRGLISG